MNPSYSINYGDLYLRHWWWRARRKFVLSHIRRAAPRGGYDRILDVGCGNGLLFPELAALGTPEGIEPDTTLISPDGRSRGTIHERSFDTTFVPDEPYGLILMLDVIEHLQNDEAALTHACSLLRPGGVLIGTVPALQTLWTNHDNWNHHYRRYTNKEIKRLVKRAGLTLELNRYYFHWLVFPKLLIHGLEKYFRFESKPEIVPTYPINTFFYGLSRMEQLSVCGMSLPFGSSIIFQARCPEKSRS